MCGCLRGQRCKGGEGRRMHVPASRVLFGRAAVHQPVVQGVFLQQFTFIEPCAVDGVDDALAKMSLESPYLVSRVELSFARH